jgi:hypothetical protein
VVNQILLGVATRGYERSLEPRPKVVSRGASKSATSRQLIKRTRSSMEAQLGRRLDDVRLIGLYLDGIVVPRQSVVVALPPVLQARTGSPEIKENRAPSPPAAAR